MRTCAEEGCNREVHAKELCDLHYQRQRSAQKPKTPPKKGSRLYGVEDVNWDVLPHDKARAAVARYVTGENAAVIATDYGVSCAAVKRWLTISRRQPKKSDSMPLDRDDLKWRLEAGHALEDLCVHFGCSRVHLRNEVYRLGLSPIMACRLAEWRARPPLAREARERGVAERRAARAARDAAMAEAYRAGETLASVSARYGMDEAGVWRILRRQGVNTRRWRERKDGVPTASQVASAQP